MDNNLVLKRFFSKSMTHDLLHENEKRLFDRVVRRYIKEPEGKSYGALISEIYAFMNKEYRTEYYYKNTMLNKLLFKSHDYEKTVALTELPIGNSKADFVMINGQGVVYEIKTALDNLGRVESQIEDYYKAFSNVVLVTYEENLGRLKKRIDENVGIMVLTKRNALNTIKKYQTNINKLDYDTIFKILRKKEFECIIKKNGMELPQVSQFRYYAECFELIKKIDIVKLQKEMLEQLKKRMRIEVVEDSIKMPLELRFLIYFDSLKANECKKLNAILNKQFGG